MRGSTYLLGALRADDARCERSPSPPALGVVKKPPAPSCRSVSVTLVRQTLGGSPLKPRAQSSASVLISHYTTVDRVCLLHQDKAAFKAEEKSYKGTAVAALGSAAFDYSTNGSHLVSLQVLDGDVVFVVSASSAGLKKIEALARAMLPLV